jgi:hypothetical protein
MQDDFLSAEELAQFQAAVHTGRGWTSAQCRPNVGGMEEVAELSIDVEYEPGMLAQGAQGGRPPPLAAQSHSIGFPLTFY